MSGPKKKERGLKSDIQPKREGKKTWGLTGGNHPSQEQKAHRKALTFPLDARCGENGKRNLSLGVVVKGLLQRRYYIEKGRGLGTLSSAWEDFLVSPHSRLKLSIYRGENPCVIRLILCPRRGGGGISDTEGKRLLPSRFVPPTRKLN